MNTTKISEIKKDVYFWIAVFNFLISLALILSQIVVFQNDYMHPIYGDDLSLGMGIIISSIGWLSISNLLRKKPSKYYLKEIIATIVLITGVVLVPHVLTFILASIILIIFAVNIYLRINHGL